MRCLCVRDFSGWLGEGERGMDSGEGGDKNTKYWTLAVAGWGWAAAKCEKVTMSVDNLK